MKVRRGVNLDIIYIVYILELQKNPIERKNGQLSFTKVYLDGTKKSVAEIIDCDYKYKALHVKEGYRIVVMHLKETKMDRTFEEFDINKLIMDSQFIALDNNTIQTNTKDCFSMINPKLPTNLIASKSLGSNEKIILDEKTGTAFIKEESMIAEATIGIIYGLRCMLFHGEIDPNYNNINLYKNAFHILF